LAAMNQQKERGGIRTDRRVFDEESGVEKDAEEIGHQRGVVVGDVDLRPQRKHRRRDDASVHEIHRRQIDIQLHERHFESQIYLHTHTHTHRHTDTHAHARTVYV